MAENVSGHGFHVCVGPEMVTETTKRVQLNLFCAFGGGLMQGINGKSGMRGYG